MSRYLSSMAVAAVSVAALAFTSIPGRAAQILYGITGSGGAASSLYTIDPATGAATLVGATGFDHVVSIDFHPLTGVLYGIANGPSVDDNSLITIDPATGVGTSLATVGEGNWTDIGFSSTATLYAWPGGPPPNDLNSINLATGIATLIGNSGLNTTQTGLDVDSSGTIYIKDGDGEIYTVNAGTGAVTSIINIGGDFDNALAFDENDVPYTIDRVGGDSELYSIDLATGSTTQIGSMGVLGMAALAFRNITAVPEPGTLAIFGLGLASLGLARRKRCACR